MTMEATDIPRRTWAPFVGAALAALTAGSLVVFSLIAQRTSLDGFPDRRITPAQSVGDPTPSSITIAPVDGTGSAGGPLVAREAPAESAPSATALLEVAQVTPPSITVDTTASDSTSTGGDPDDEATTFARADAPTGSFRAEQSVPARRVGGGNYDDHGSYATHGWDARHGGRHSHKSHDPVTAREQARAKAERQRAKKSKRATAANRRRGGDHPARGNGNGHGNGRRASSNGNASSGERSPRSRPAPASSKPAAKSKGSSGSPPAHSNAGGNGKSRGRGHKKH